jgi:hypothetical protein
MIALSRTEVITRGGSAAMLAAALFCVQGPSVAQAQAQEPPKSAPPMPTRVAALIPDLEAYIRSGMKAYDVPGLAIGIVTGDRLVYAKGFGVRSKSGGAPVELSRFASPARTACRSGTRVGQARLLQRPFPDRISRGLPAPWERWAILSQERGRVSVMVAKQSGPRQQESRPGG